MDLGLSQTKTTHTCPHKTGINNLNKLGRNLKPLIQSLSLLSNNRFRVNSQGSLPPRSIPSLCLVSILCHTLRISIFHTLWLRFTRSTRTSLQWCREWSTCRPSTSKKSLCFVAVSLNSKTLSKPSFQPLITNINSHSPRVVRITTSTLKTLAPNGTQLTKRNNNLPLIR